MRRTISVATAGITTTLFSAAALAADPVGPVRPAGLLERVLELQDVECADCEHGCAHAKTLRARFARGENPDGSPIALTPPPADALFTDLLHNDLRIEIDPTNQSIAGSNRLTFRVLVNNLTQIRVRLQDIFGITELKVNGVDAGASQLDSAHLTVFLDRPYNTDEIVEILVGYSGFPQNNGYDSINFTTQGGQPIVSTLSETDFAYTWWPNKDDNRDKSTADLRFTVPSTMSVASNGSLISVTNVPGGKKEWYWKTNYPTATYLYSFSATNYNRFSASYNWGGGVMPLEFFIYPGSDTTTNRNAWLQTVTMLGTFRDIFGLYPFINEKYGIYQFPFGGGMEHQTMTGQGTFVESVTAHELGHQWWGDMVTCATWNEIWLNEGFATYSEALWLERKPGSTGAPALHAAMASRRPSSVNGTIYIPEPLDHTNINRIFSTSFSYRKPAWVLHMLRHVVGDAAFFEILTQWRAAYEFKSVTTADFRAVCEQVSGRDLGWFFDQWIYQPGAPAYLRAWRATTAGGQAYVELYLRQSQTSPAPVFTMPMDLVLTVDGAPVTRTIWNDAQTEWFVLPVSGLATAVQFDPTPWILATANANTSFVEGPPTIVRTTPAPQSSSPASSVLAVDVVFHKAVSATAADFSLIGDTTGPAAFSFSYAPSTKTATLTSTSGPLLPDSYTLSVSDAIRETATNKQLDGEVVGGVLPSGQGQAGGSAVIRFTVAPPPVCDGDADGDRDRDFADVTSVLTAFGASYGGGSSGPGDANRDGTVNFADITSVLSLFGVACP